MAWTQTEIDTLKAAIARGVRKVVFVSPGGVRREQEYASLAEMERALSRMQAEVNPAVYGRAAAVAEHSRD